MKKNLRPSILKRQFLINPKCQLLMIAYTYVVVAAALFTNVLMQSYWQNYSEYLASDAVPSWARHFGLYFSLAMTGMLSISTVFGLYISNQVAGPVYRACQHMKALRETGKCAPMVLREGDQFQELAEQYNLLLKELMPERVVASAQPEGKSE